MIAPLSRRPLARSIFAGAAILAGTTATLWSIHPKNAGPASFEIKFKLPAPKPLSPEEALRSFKVAPGFRVELFAAEPMVEAPIAISFDEKGRAWVCEMRGYMHDVEGAGEDQPVGRITILEDTDGDGKADKRTVFADGLVMPRSVTCVNGGALVGEPPALWFMRDTDGDGKADTKELVDGSFGSRTGQPEHMANSPTWMLDNWIATANHTSRYRLRDGKFVVDGAISRGQYGLSQDDFGRAFYNFNSDFLRANLVPESLARRNPNFTPSAGLGFQVVKDQAVWPAGPTPGVNRGYEPNALREDGSLKASTGTCGAGIYRGGLFGREVAGNAFIPEPAANLVKRFILEEKDGVVTGRNAYDKAEFWTSTDERFRPVAAYTGPDGALWVADMYRGVIQHKGFLTHYLVANIKDRKLEQPLNQGRIWRVVPEGAKAATVALPAEPAKLVAFLSHDNGWVRDTAQRLLVEKKDASVIPALEQLAQSGASPLARIHALWAMEGIGRVSPAAVAVGLKDKDAKVRATAVRLADRSLAGELVKLVQDPSLDVQIALGYQVGAPELQAALLALARRSGKEPMVREAILSGLRGRELEIIEAALASPGEQMSGEVLTALSQAVMSERRAPRVKQLIKLIAAQPGNSAAQLALLAGTVPAKGSKPKILYLEAEAPELAKLAAAADAKAKPLVAALDARVAWPGKPGVPPPPVVKPLTAQEQQLFETGRTVYATLCAACHQPTGLGMEGLAPPLVESEWVLGRTDTLARVILHGLSGPIKVNGKEWSMEMPPLGAALTDEQVAGVMTYIRREWEHTESPVSAAAVAKLRAQHQDRTRTWTAEDLAALKGDVKEAKR
jgi:mono/diheme cytochrome c family protein/glucose/arabinose dehydrogenase